MFIRIGFHFILKSISNCINLYIVDVVVAVVIVDVHINICIFALKYYKSQSRIWGKTTIDIHTHSNTLSQDNLCTCMNSIHLHRYTNKTNQFLVKEKRPFSMTVFEYKNDFSKMMLLLECMCVCVNVCISVSGCYNCVCLCVRKEVCLKMVGIDLHKSICNVHLFISAA